MSKKLGALVVAGIAVVASPVVAQERLGGPGPDRLVGTAKADELAGRGGADRLRGRGGDDVLLGGRGPDRLIPGKGEDGVNMRNGVELASPGRDVIRARDGEADQISCGAGRDRAIVDTEEEGVYDCETVIEPKAASG